MPQYRFTQVDVFTARPFYGNPVAVVLEADDIDEADMQRIARWTNLSETTFVLRPTTPAADYRLRIFTPEGELPFAGHPTVGSAHAVLEAGVVPLNGELTQECGAGLLPITITGAGPQREIAVLTPVPRVVADRAPSTARLSAVLGVPLSDRATPLTIDVGPVWVIACVDAVEAVQRMTPDPAALVALSRELQVTGVTVFSLGPSGAPLHVRSFAPAAGVPEDPVCGSGNASVGAYLALTGLLAETGASYTASQGTELGRDGTIRVQVADGGRQIRIGGHAVTVVDGVLRL